MKWIYRTAIVTGPNSHLENVALWANDQPEGVEIIGMIHHGGLGSGKFYSVVLYRFCSVPAQPVTS